MWSNCSMRANKRTHITLNTLVALPTRKLSRNSTFFKSSGICWNHSTWVKSTNWQVIAFKARNRFDNLFVVFLFGIVVYNCFNFIQISPRCRVVNFGNIINTAIYCFEVHIQNGLTFASITLFGVFFHLRYSGFDWDNIN